MSDSAVSATVRFLLSDYGGRTESSHEATLGGSTAADVDAAIEGYSFPGLVLDDVVLLDWSPRDLTPDDFGFTTTRRNLE